MTRLDHSASYPAGATRDGPTISVVGAGHVGLVTGVCLAAVGYRATLLDIDVERVARLGRGEAPFMESGLDEMLRAGLASGRLSVHTEAAEAMAAASVIFVCVDTPPGEGRSVDLSAVVSAAQAVIRHAPDGSLLVSRCTAPVGTAEYLRSLVEEARGSAIDVAVNPEFLAEGTAVRDFFSPDRVVVGAWTEGAGEVLRAVYDPIVARRLPESVEIPAGRAAGIGPEHVPFLLVDPPTAELIKYAANAFLAVKISFINEVASISEELGADISSVARAIGLDRRIGPSFLRPGIGWGGSCFPKDIVALQGMAETRGLHARILRAAHEVNFDQQRWVIRKLQHHLRTMVGRRIGLLGLSFKPNTDDLRNAPALDIAAELSSLGAGVRAYDPSVTKLPADVHSHIEVVPDAAALAQGAEALVLVTEWPQFLELDLVALRKAMRVPLLVDGRNFLNSEDARAAGFHYVGVGRPDVPPAR